MFQALLSPIVICLIWRSARSLGGSLAEGVAAPVLALPPAPKLYDTPPMPCVWINLTDAATLCFLFAWHWRRRLRNAAVAGLIYGISVLLKPNVLP